MQDFISQVNTDFSNLHVLGVIGIIFVISLIALIYTSDNFKSRKIYKIAIAINFLIIVIVSVTAMCLGYVLETQSVNEFKADYTFNITKDNKTLVVTKGKRTQSYTIKKYHLTESEIKDLLKNDVKKGDDSIK